MSAIKLYCLSGLGTDERAFKNIHVDNVELVHIPWIDNLENESLSDYAKRLFNETNPEEDYNLIGLSFGGMIAAEWEKIRSPKTLFLLSTVSDKSQLPWTIKLAGKLRLHRIIPMSILSTPNALTYYIFGIRKNANRAVFKEILRDTDPKHLKWAMNALMHWSNDSTTKAIKIHGDNDRLLPMKGEIDHTIKGGGHMIILNEGEAISKIIQEAI